MYIPYTKYQGQPIKPPHVNFFDLRDQSWERAFTGLVSCSVSQYSVSQISVWILAKWVW